MLTALSVRNIVLIDKLDLSLEPGLTALTGETGAGKSIVLDSLGLALGARGDQSLVRTGSDSGQITAVLDLPANHRARTIMAEGGIADDGDIFLRRVQFADGRTKAFINDQPVSAALLRLIGGAVIEIHGQHDDRALVDPASHRDLLDAFAGHADQTGEVAAAYTQLRAAEKALKTQRDKILQAQRDEEYARHIVEELTELAPAIGEEETLAERRQTLMQLEKAAAEVNEIDEALNGPAAAGPVLSSLMRRLSRKSGGEEGDIFSPIVESLDQTLLSLDRTQDALEQLKRDMLFDPHELEQAEERLFALRAAARKHQVTCDGLPEILARYLEQLAELEKGQQNVAELERAELEARATYARAAAALTAARENAATELAGLVDAELPDLKLANAHFIVSIETDLSRQATEGQDHIQFEVQTNPGAKPGPIMKVASGGELSRFLLALKVVLADRGSAPVLIFDEIDTGVGGAVADAIGRRLARLAEKVQVLSVTHAPQVAARAATHLLIEKSADGDNSVVTSVRNLPPNLRQEEVARMLAGAEITEEARAAAGRLLKEAV